MSESFPLSFSQQQDMEESTMTRTPDKTTPTADNASLEALISILLQCTLGLRPEVWFQGKSCTFSIIFIKVYKSYFSNVSIGEANQLHTI